MQDKGIQVFTGDVGSFPDDVLFCKNISIIKLHPLIQFLKKLAAFLPQQNYFMHEKLFA